MNFSKRNKRGAINFSLSWVFMIFVGTFFLVLAYNVVDKYMENEEMKYQMELRDTLRGVFNDYGRTTGTEKNALAKLGNIFKNSKVEISCHDGTMPILSINGNYDANNEYLRSYPTFMTYIDQEDVDWSYLAVENFKMPFKITNLMAIVSKKNLIVIDSSSKFGEKLYEKFEKGSYDELNYIYEDFSTINKDTFIPNFVDGRNLNSVVFATDDDGNAFPIDFLSEIKPMAFGVRVEEIGDNYGNIKFLDKTGETYSYKYIDYDDSLSLQTMAVFSKPQTFNCSYNLLMDSTVAIYGFYINKTSYYHLLDDVICVSSFTLPDQKYYFEEFRDALTGIKNEVKNNKFNNYGMLSNNITKLDNLYYRLENNNCPDIY
jgi:hypothetical protein